MGNQAVCVNVWVGGKMEIAEIFASQISTSKRKVKYDQFVKL